MEEHVKRNSQTTTAFKKYNIPKNIIKKKTLPHFKGLLASRWPQLEVRLLVMMGVCFGLKLVD